MSGVIPPKKFATSPDEEPPVDDAEIATFPGAKSLFVATSPPPPSPPCSDEPAFGDTAAPDCPPAAALLLLLFSDGPAPVPTFSLAALRSCCRCTLRSTRCLASTVFPPLCRDTRPAMPPLLIPPLPRSPSLPTGPPSRWSGEERGGGDRASFVDLRHWSKRSTLSLASPGSPGAVVNRLGRRSSGTIP